jgi:hypothetical protein
MSCVINSAGLGMYVSGFPCAFDQVFDPGSSLAACMAQSGLATGLGQLLPAHPVIYPQFIAPKGLGCGCAGMGCGCAGVGGLTMDGTGLLGTGLFSGGMDLSTWGVGEYLVLAFGAYAVYSLVSDVGKGARNVRKRLRRKKAA